MVSHQSNAPVMMKSVKSLYSFRKLNSRNNIPVIKTYNNFTNEITSWDDSYLGFGNSLPKEPLEKVKVGKNLFMEICKSHNREENKSQFIEELIRFLKSEERHLPDPELQRRRPEIYKYLSSIFVNIPEGRYGTRAHTIILITKQGSIDVIEISLQAPADMSNPVWKIYKYQI